MCLYILHCTKPIVPGFELKNVLSQVIVVGIGGDVDKDELRSIVQDPVDDLFLVASFEDLARLLDDQRLTEAFCFPTRK